MNAGKRLPAYGRALVRDINAGHEPLHGIAVWIDRAPAVKRTCLAQVAVFLGVDPEEIDWSMCRGRDIWVPQSDEVQVHRLFSLVRCLIAANPRRLILMIQTPPYLIWIIDSNGIVQ